MARLAGIGIAFDRFVRGVVGFIVLWLAVLGVMQVFFRYALGSSLSWTEELSRFLLIWLVLIAAAAEVGRAAHITVNIVVDLLPGVARRVIELVNLVLMLAFAAIMTVYGFKLVGLTMSQHATTLPLWMGQVYLAIPVGGILMMINLLRLLWRRGFSSGMQS